MERKEIRVPIRSLVTIRVTGEFFVYKNGEIIAPRSTTDRYAQFKATNKDKIEILTEADYQAHYKMLPNDKEENSGESLTEIIPDSEISMFERMKAEIMGSMSQFAEDRGMDTLDEEDDYSYDDLDNEAPITEYEFQEMKEEFWAPPGTEEEQEHPGQGKLDFEENEIPKKSDDQKETEKTD